MRAVLNKSNAVWHAIVLAVRPSRKAVSVKETVKSSTMSDTIGLVVLIMFLLGLSQGRQIDVDNRKDPDV